MLDEFPALGRLDFFETSLAFMAGYGVRAFLVAQSLHQIDKAYGAEPRHPRQLPRARRLRAQRRAHGPAPVRCARHGHGAAAPQRTCPASGCRPGCRTRPMSEQETPRPLLTPGEVLQLPADEALVLVSGTPPIRASKLQYYADRNFLARCLPAPPLSRRPLRRCAAGARRRLVRPDARRTDRAPGEGLVELVATTSTADENPPRTREIPPRRSRQNRTAHRRPAAVRWRALDPSAEDATTRRRPRSWRQRGAVPGAEALTWPRRRYTLYLSRAAGAQARPGGQGAPRRQVGAGRGGAAREPRAAAACPASRTASRAGSTSSTGRSRRSSATIAGRHRDAGAVRALLPDRHAAAAGQRAGAGAHSSARKRYEVFVAEVGRRLAEDHRLASEVLQTIPIDQPDLFATCRASRQAAPLRAVAACVQLGQQRGGQRSWLISSRARAEEAQGRRRQMLRTAFGPTIAAALADPDRASR